MRSKTWSKYTNTYEFGFNTKIGKKYVEDEYINSLTREGNRTIGEVEVSPRDVGIKRKIWRKRITYI